MFGGGTGRTLSRIGTSQREICMKLTRTTAQLATCALLLSLAPDVHAYMVDIGYTALQNELGAAVPTGANVRVAQVEAPINDVSGGAAPIFMPNPSNQEFVGKTLTPIGGNPSGSYSDHATAVGALFYGAASSIAPGIGTINVYEANNWINSLPGLSGSGTTGLNRVTNHSWIGGGNDVQTDATILRLVDRQVAATESIQVVGLTNGPGNSPLLGGSGYNVIAVGRTDGFHQQGSVAVDTVYGAGRTVPTVVAPMGTTSAATPVVSAAATLLVQTGHQGGLSLSEGSTAVSGVGTVYNAERSETIKAALMAGADRQTANTSTTNDITDYRSAGHETANGLDNRYGAGQVNIFNSYHILAGGEQRSQQNGGADIAAFGFDHGTIGGLNGTGHAASYFFNTTGNVSLFASLVWNLSVADNAQLTTRLYNLDLSLYDVTHNQLIATSSSLLDNTENLYFRLLLGNRYEIRVTTSESTDFTWDYALAWRMDAAPAPVPVPAAAWLFGSGLAALAALALHRGPA
jgi:hypothetical protein